MMDAWLPRGICHNNRKPHVRTCSMADDHPLLEEKEQIKRFTSNHLSASPDEQVLPGDAISALCQHHLVSGTEVNSPSITLVESIATHPDAVPDTYESNHMPGYSTIPIYSPEKLSRHQSSDLIIGQVIQTLECADEANLVPNSLELKLIKEQNEKWPFISDMLKQRWWKLPVCCPHVSLVFHPQIFTWRHGTYGFGKDPGLGQNKALLAENGCGCGEKA